jgi:hypothetical protein
VYNARQIAGIRRACQIGREVLDIAGERRARFFLHGLRMIHA